VKKKGLEIYVEKDDPFSESVLLALREMNLEYQTILLEEVPTEELKRPPSAPILVVDGKLILHEVYGILHYLAIQQANHAAFPTGDLPLFAEISTRLAEAQYLFRIARDILSEETPAPGGSVSVNWRDQKYELPMGSPALSTAWSKSAPLKKELALWNQYVGPNFAVGGVFTLVDAAIYPFLHLFYTMDKTIFDEFPRLKAYYLNFSNRHAPKPKFYTLRSDSSPSLIFDQVDSVSTPTSKTLYSLSIPESNYVFSPSAGKRQRIDNGFGDEGGSDEVTPQPTRTTRRLEPTQSGASSTDSRS